MVAVGGKLWIDLWAADYNNATVPQSWDNRASPGPVSFNNGDFFTGTASNQFPTKTVILGVPAIVFNVSADTVMDNVTSNLNYFPQIGSWYGQSDWTIGE